MPSGSPQRHRSSHDSQNWYASDQFVDERTPQPPMQPGQTFFNDVPHRARSHSAAPMPVNNIKVPSQPIRDEVNAAVHQSNITQDVSPDLVAQITQQVLTSLKLNGIHPGQTSSGSVHGDDLLPTSTITSAQRNTYAHSFAAHSSPSLNNHAPAAQEESNIHHVDGQVDRETRHRKMADSPERMSSPPKPREREQFQRPPAPPRAPTDDATTLEKIWQPLFSSDGDSLPRLGQFLRGLALHIIEDYEPKNSLVINPQKMSRFYEEMRISKETYPWKTIFGGKLKHSSLSHLYRDLRCQHHFVQAKRDDKPTVPALTPQGFQTWMTLMIQAQPDDEYERFTQAVLNMPISNADNRKERFPKELSRRLFPKKADSETLWDIEDAMLRFDEIDFPSSEHSSSHVDKSTRTPSPPRDKDKQQAAPSMSGHQSVSPAVERKSRPRREASVTDEEEDEGVPAKPIERQRKPYFAQPGGGKMYDDFAENEVRKVKSESIQSVHPAIAPQTAAGTAFYRPAVGDGQDEYYERSSPSRTGSHPPSQSLAPARRQRSSSTHANPYARSEGDVPSSSGTYKPANYVPDSNIDSRIRPTDAGQRRFLDDEPTRGAVSPQHATQSQLPSYRHSVDDEHRRRATVGSTRGTDGSGGGGVGAASNYHAATPAPPYLSHPPSSSSSYLTQLPSRPPPPPTVTFTDT